MMFEDGPSSPLVDLIQRVYNDSDVCIDFVGGVGNLKNKIIKLPDNDLVVAYIDLVPDNPETGKEYKTLIAKIRKRNNTVIVPVLCTDYILLRACTDTDISVHDMVCGGSYPIGIKTAEKYSKYLLDTYKDCLSFGRFSVINSNTAMFYSMECLCKSTFADCRVLSLYDKGVKFVTALPMFIGFKTTVNLIKADYKKYVNTYLHGYNHLVEYLFNSGKYTKMEYDKAYITDKCFYK